MTSTQSTVPIGPIQELRRRIRLTSGARFEAARRLRRHEGAAQWSLTLGSIALIVIPLFQALGVEVAWSPEAANAIQVILAVTVLAFSLRLGHGNWAVRADRMDQCAIRLRRLERRLIPLEAGSVPEEEFTVWERRYSKALENAENHRTVDFELHRVYYRSEYYPDGGWIYYWHVILGHWRLAVEFVPYFTLLAALGVGVWLLVT